MFSLMAGLWRYMFQKDDYYIVIVGLDNAGKTTFLEQTKVHFNPNYKGMNLNKVTTTVGLNIGRVETEGIRVNFWDLGGQGELQSLWDKYYSESHGIIYVVDSADIERIDESKAAFEKMIANESLDKVPLLLVANKQDLPEALTLTRIKDIFLDTEQHLQSREITSVPASAIKGDGIEGSINWMISHIKSNSHLRPPRNPDD